MRTTLNIRDEIVADVMRLTGAPTRSAAVNQALAEWLRRARLVRLKALRGKLTLDIDIDELRGRELAELEPENG